MLTVSPGFGADYGTVEELTEAWRADREFVVMTTGRYVSRSQLETTGVPEGKIRIRFRQKTAVWVIDDLPSLKSPNLYEESVMAETIPLVPAAPAAEKPPEPTAAVTPAASTETFPEKIEGVVEAAATTVQGDAEKVIQGVEGTATEIETAVKTFDFTSFDSKVLFPFDLHNYEVLLLKALMEGETLSERAKNYIPVLLGKFYTVIDEVIAPLEGGLKSLQASTDPMDQQKAAVMAAQVNEVKTVHVAFQNIKKA